MSGFTGAALLGASMIGSAYLSSRSAKKAAKSQAKAYEMVANQQAAQAERLAEQQNQASRRASGGEAADVSGVLRANSLANNGVGSSTLLTSATGVAKDRLTLGGGGTLG